MEVADPMVEQQAECCWVNLVVKGDESMSVHESEASPRPLAQPLASIIIGNSVKASSLWFYDFPYFNSGPSYFLDNVNNAYDKQSITNT